MTRPLSVQVAERLVPWRRLDWPLDWRAVFGREAPLVVELGFGNGAYLEREARHHPEREHVGVEVSWTSASQLVRRAERSGLANVRIVLADALVALRQLFASETVEALVANHPCPWPKARHVERRLVRPELAAVAADRLRPGGVLAITTDHAEYALQVADVLRGEPALRPLHRRAFVHAVPRREPTKYERKAMAEGARLYHFLWTRRGRPAALPPAASSDPLDRVPSVTFHGAHDASRLLEGFETLVHREEERGVPVLVKLGDAWLRADGSAWLVDVLTREGELQQDFCLEVVSLPFDRVLVKLSHLGYPHPTFGAKRAVALLASHLRERHRGFEVASETVGERAKAGTDLR